MTQNVTDNGIKLLGESLVPGASLLLDGNVKGGALHTIVGTAAKLVFGRIGLVLVALDSFSVSTTGKYLHQQFRSQPAPAPAAPAAEPAAKPSHAKA